MHPAYPDLFSILHQSLFPSDQSVEALYNSEVSGNNPDATNKFDINAGITQDYYSVSSSTDWNYIYTEMQAQAVSSLAYPWLKNNTIPDSSLQNKWITSCLQQQARWIQVMHAQDQLIKLMEQHNIPCVIIKGAAAMIAYPHPTMRSAGDIDFLVKRKDYDKAAIILENNGYHQELKKDPNHHHYNYEKNGVIFELHKRLGIINDSDNDLISLFECGIDNRFWATIGDYTFPILPNHLNGLVLLLHINQHLRSGIGLRQIIDWMMYINNNNFETILPLISMTDMEKLAKTITVMCQKYLGLPNIIEDSNDYPYDELMEYIITKGNLGGKTGTEGRITSASLIITNPILFFSKLQQQGLYNWNATKHYKILRPFAWLYQLGITTRFLITQRITPRRFKKAFKEGNKDRDLINKLGLKTNRTVGDH